MLTLIELLAAHPRMFYRQAWYADESFMRAIPNEDYYTAPRVMRPGAVPPSGRGLPLAVELANAYVRTPDDPAWSGYLWARDVDHLGQRIYVGGTANGHGFEIHRHLHLTERWGTPRW